MRRGPQAFSSMKEVDRDFVDKAVTAMVLITSDERATEQAQERATEHITVFQAGVLYAIDVTLGLALQYG